MPRLGYREEPGHRSNRLGPGPLPAAGKRKSAPAQFFPNCSLCIHSDYKNCFTRDLLLAYGRAWLPLLGLGQLAQTVAPTTLTWLAWKCPPKQIKTNPFEE